MRVEELIASTRESLAGVTPRYIDMNEACDRAAQGIADMALEKVQSALEQAILGAQSALQSTAAEYIDALYVTDDLRIAIRDDKAHLENGWSEQNMLGDLLSSPKAKTGKDGDKYIAVPMGGKRQPDLRASIGKKASELFSKSKGKASSRSLDDMVKSMQDLANKTQPQQGPEETRFRIASEKQDGEDQWVHPGFRGVHQLAEINANLEASMRDEAVAILRYEIDTMRR